MPDIYRSAASILVLRANPQDSSSYELLLLHKPRKNDSWQLPQGGVEKGETIEQAAVRELKEEASVDGCRVLGTSEVFYKYDFPAGFRRFRPDNVCGQQINFVLALAPENTQVTVDGVEVDGFVWVTMQTAVKYVKRKEYLELMKGLYEEALVLMRG